MEKDSTTPFVSRPRQMSETVIKARKREMDRREAVLDAEIESVAQVAQSEFREKNQTEGVCSAGARLGSIRCEKLHIDT